MPCVLVFKPAYTHMRARTRCSRACPDMYGTSTHTDRYLFGTSLPSMAICPHNANVSLSALVYENSYAVIQPETQPDDVLVLGVQRDLTLATPSRS